MTLKSITTFLQLIRYKNLLILLLTQCFVFFILLDETLDIRFWSLLFATFFAAASGNIINDLMDKETDRINHPEKKLLQNNKAWYILMILFLVGSLFLSLNLPIEACLVVIINNVLLLLYSTYLKGLPLIGNIAISYLTASSVYLFYLVYDESHTELMVFSVFTFIIHLIREIIKDAEDIEGDKKAGYKTLPIVIGLQNTKTLILLIEVLFIPVLLYFSLKITTSLFLYNSIIVLPFVFFIIYKTYKAKQKKNYNSISNWCKLLMLFGLLGMLFC